jgi:hypothetical protein
MQQKIEYEYEIIRTKRIHYSADKIKILKIMKNKIVVEKANCADRDIPVECWKIPNNFFDNEVISSLYYKCESLRELLLSKYFQKFIGFDDLNYEDYQLFFFEHIEKIQLIQLIKARELSTAENSMLFRYLSKEILLCFRDLLYKCTHSFKFPINIENFYFEVDQLRLFINNVDYGPPRKTILDSHDMIESKLLFSYGIILIQVLALSNPNLRSLFEEITEISKNFSDLNQMQMIFDEMNKYEQILTNNLEDDFVISLIIECLISPYKAKLVFDEFYEKKNFFKDIFKDSDTNIINKKSVPARQAKNMTKSEALNSDQLIAFENYYEDVIDDKNEMLPKRILTLNYLLIHPYYERIKFENNYISYLFKDMSSIIGNNENNKINNLNNLEK